MQLDFTQWELKAWFCMHSAIQELEELEWFPNGAVQSTLCLILLKYDQCQHNTHILYGSNNTPNCALIESNHPSIHLSAYMRQICPFCISIKNINIM